MTALFTISKFSFQALALNRSSLPMEQISYMSWVAEGVLNRNQPWQNWKPKFLVLKGAEVQIFDSPPVMTNYLRLISMSTLYLARHHRLALFCTNVQRTLTWFVRRNWSTVWLDWILPNNKCISYPKLHAGQFDSLYLAPYIAHDGWDDKKGVLRLAILNQRAFLCSKVLLCQSLSKEN